MKSLSYLGSFEKQYDRKHLVIDFFILKVAEIARYEYCGWKLLKNTCMECQLGDIYLKIVELVILRKSMCSIVRTIYLKKEKADQ